MDDPEFKFRQGEEAFSLPQKVQASPGAHLLSYSVGTRVKEDGT
jgi:hypothetical protein